MSDDECPLSISSICLGECIEEMIKLVESISTEISDKKYTEMIDMIKLSNGHYQNLMLSYVNVVEIQGNMRRIVKVNNLEKYFSEPPPFDALRRERKRQDELFNTDKN